MKNKESNKYGKKKLFILVLLLFMIIGIAGYGVYSYFYTSGSYTARTNDISIASFNPNIDGDFLGDGGTLTLTCPESETGSGTVECTGTLQISNGGNTDIDLSISDVLVNLDEISHDNVTAEAGTPVFVWENGGTTIGAGNNKRLTVTVPVTLSSDFASSEGYSRDSAYEGEAIGVTVSFKITAEQVH